jgi:hypothetical protein
VNQFGEVIMVNEALLFHEATTDQVRAIYAPVIQLPRVTVDDVTAANVTATRVCFTAPILPVFVQD